MEPSASPPATLDDPGVAPRGAPSSPAAGLAARSRSPARGGPRPPSVRPRTITGRPLLGHPGPPPRRPLLVRRDPGAGAGGAAARRRPQLVRVAADPHRVPDHGGHALDSWFPHLKWSPSKVAARERQRAGRRLGGDDRLPELAAAAPDAQPAAGARGDDGVLGEPLQRAGQRRRRLHLAGALRPRHPGPGARTRSSRCSRPSSVHPAMGMYLGNAVSDKDHPNENQGRELLELHTVGLGAGYQRARRRRLGPDPDRLAGRRCGTPGTPVYNELAHYTGKVRVLGFHRPNHSDDGRKVTRDYLHYLAHHPVDRAAHRHRSWRRRSSSDNPPRALVNHLAHVYLAHGTQIKPVLRALVDSAEFKHSVGARYPRPRERPGRDVPADGRPRRQAARRRPRRPPAGLAGRADGP